MRRQEQEQDRITDANCMICNAKYEHEELYFVTTIARMDFNICDFCKKGIEKKRISKSEAGAAYKSHLEQRVSNSIILQRFKGNFNKVLSKIDFKKKNKISTEAKQYE
jgi:hypothetical protein